MKKNNEVSDKKILLLSKIFYVIRDNTFYIARKYVSVPLKINQDFKKCNSKKAMRIRANLQITNESGSVDDLKIKSIAYYSNAIFNFITVLEKNFSKAVLRNFYYNVNNVSVNEVKEMIGASRATGRYSLFNNFIDLKENSVNSIYHELFHMSSTKVLGNLSYSGLSICNGKNDNCIGVGINEGYTQLMAERYFGNDVTLHFLEKNYGIENTKKIVGSSYSFQVLVASKLEKIIGKQKMEELYLKADLYGMVTELKKYASKEEISNFISKMDFLHNNINNVYVLSLKNKKIKVAFLEITNFLLQCYSKMLDTQWDDKFLYKDYLIQEYIEEFSYFYDRYFSISKCKRYKKI